MNVKCITREFGADRTVLDPDCRDSIHQRKLILLHNKLKNKARETKNNQGSF
jgi:hypothetical protein